MTRSPNYKPKILRVRADYYINLRKYTQGDRALGILVSIFLCQMICWLLFTETCVTLHVVTYKNIMWVKCWKTGFRGEYSEVG